MRKRKICVVVTARPSYSRIQTALRAIDDHPALELQLVVAASALLERYGNAIQAIEHDGFVPAARVYMVLEGENLVTSAKSTGLGLVELATVFDNLAPDAVVTVADRYETLATAVAASYMNIPVVHVQGGEVTGSIDEKVRHAVQPAPRVDRIGARARDQAWRGAGNRRDDRLPVYRHRGRRRGAAGPRFRPVRQVRRRRTARGPVERLSGRDAASGHDGIRRG